MYAHVRIPAISALFLAAALAACDNGTSTGTLPSDFDAPAVQSLVNALMTPSQALNSPTGVLEDAFPELVARGMTFDRGGATTALGLPRLDPAASVVIPDSLSGKTFVYDAQQQSWLIDPDRTGAPADAVRIVWYTTDASGSVLIPLDERGYIDLTDEDTPSLSQLGVLMVDTAAASDITVADFTQGYTTTDSTQWTNHAEAAGFFGDGTTQVDFSLASDASGNDDTGDNQATLTVTLGGPSSSYEMTVDATEDGATGTIDQTLSATATGDPGTTELELTITQESSGAQSGSGNVAYNGTVIARITIDGDSFRYQDAGGNSLSAGAAAELDNLVRALFFAGLDLTTRLPLLFP